MLENCWKFYEANSNSRVRIGSGSESDEKISGSGKGPKSGYSALRRYLQMQSLESSIPELIEEDSFLVWIKRFR